jgi:glyoxylase-like metal-dependent hydrolase (beta-lactamase superfamily II)
MSRTKIISGFTALLTIVLNYFGILTVPGDKTAFEREGWLLSDVPAYCTGLLSKNLYDAGPGMEDDNEGPTAEDSYMQVIRWTNAGEYMSYLDKLERFGYSEVFENRIEDNFFAEYEKEGSLVYAYYNKSTKTARVIKDNSSVPLDEFGYTYEPLKNEKTVVYQYGLYYGENEDGVTADCGMLYVIKLADNSIIIVDGGNREQATDLAVNGFYDFLKEITNTQSGEKIRIAAWYGTHAHSDHYMLFCKFLRLYADKISLERVMFNYPSDDVLDMWEGTLTLRSRIRQYFPDALYLKLHTGQKIQLADVTAEVLYTHEDNVNAFSGKSSMTSFNESSTIIKFTCEKTTFIMLADCYQQVQNILLNNFSGAVLKSDIVQVSHHGFNNVGRLYKHIDAEIALVPQSRYKLVEDNADVYRAIKKYTDASNIYFSGEGTYGISRSDGEFSVSYRELVGSVYDGSEM